MLVDFFKQQRTGQPYWDSAVALPTFAAGLPEPLRPHPSALSHEQFCVYEDFDVNSCRFIGTSVHGPVPFPHNEQHALPYINGSTMPEIHPAHDSYVSRSTQQIIIELERLLDQMPPTQAASSLPANHNISLLIRQIFVTASQVADREDTVLAFLQNVVQLLYKAPTQLRHEVYAALLDRLCETSAQRKFNVPVTALLLKSNLVPIMEQDAQLAKLIMRDLKSSTINFTAGLIWDYLLGPAPYVSHQHFRHSLDALGHTVQLRKGIDASQWTFARHLVALRPLRALKDVESLDVPAQCTALFFGRPASCAQGPLNEPRFKEIWAVAVSAEIMERPQKDMEEIASNSRPSVRGEAEESHGTYSLLEVL
ncbi:hypothetical protein BS47DRAFT_1397968 [Hydnum rufescens UP504]|uniref:CCR4-NOT transcription complex subunit 1-like NOT1 connector domain-containing protein n=1 Tax=Hydnum rufescens UP504 TaxID=1448309 RepID=A0A9P6ALW0_9AGAM|nr:hypothetical protein BS47DRAFT_1397968 [Hydnum rufescens UP504]